MNKTVVKIQGSEYQMVGDTPVEKMHKIAEYVDSEMNMIAEANSKLSTSAVAILTSLNIADLLFECSEENERLLAQVKEISENSSCDEKKYSELEDIISQNRVELEKKNAEISNLEIRMQELMGIINDKKKEILELKNSDKKSEAFIELEKKLAEAEKRAEESEKLASEFQNRAYEIQMKYEAK